MNQISKFFGVKADSLFSQKDKSKAPARKPRQSVKRAKNPLSPTKHIQNKNQDDLEFFRPEFIELINGMLECDSEKRFKIEDIKASKWYNGAVMDAKELKSEMRPRWNEVNQRKEEQNQQHY